MKQKFTGLAEYLAKLCNAVERQKIQLFNN